MCISLNLNLCIYLLCICMCTPKPRHSCTVEGTYTYTQTHVPTHTHTHTHISLPESSCVAQILVCCYLHFINYRNFWFPCKLLQSSIYHSIMCCLISISLCISFYIYYSLCFYFCSCSWVFWPHVCINTTSTTGV